LNCDDCLLSIIGCPPPHTSSDISIWWWRRTGCHLRGSRRWGRCGSRWRCVTRRATVVVAAATAQGLSSTTQRPRWRLRFTTHDKRFPLASALARLFLIHLHVVARLAFLAIALALASLLRPVALRPLPCTCPLRFAARCPIIGGRLIG